MSQRKQYTDKEKIAYYKAKASSAQRGYTTKSGYSTRSGKVSGRGGYKSGPPKMKKPKSSMSAIAGLGGVGGPIGTALGTALGGPVGGLIGGGLGTLAGSLFKHFVGKGDYQVVNNCFLKGGALIEPVINRHNSGGDLFRRQEYISDIITASTPNTFLLQSFDVNPGLESTFLWLSQVACNYEEYEIEGMYFEFRSMSADALNSTNTALGQVIMAANYNAASANFTNKQAMENYEGGISCRPSESMRYFVECAKNQSVLNNLYIRQGAVPTGQDQRMYDLCNFQIATNGFQGASVNIGELWVSYQVCLRKPKLFAALGYYNSWASASPSTGAYTNLLPLGSSGAWTFGTANNLIDYQITATTQSWHPPSLPQSYVMYYTWTGSSTAITFPSFTATNGLTITGNNNGPRNGETSISATRFQFVVYDPKDNPSNGRPTITVGTAGVLPSSGTAFSCYIIQTPSP